jgi:hypothetical protein
MTQRRKTRALVIAARVDRTPALWWLAALALALMLAVAAHAQTTQPSVPPAAAEPPGTSVPAIIKPPVGVDPGIQKQPPVAATPGTVIPPPGTAGGNPSVQPK